MDKKISNYELHKKVEELLKKHNLKPEKRLIERFINNIEPIIDALNDDLLESLVIENLTIGESYFFRDMQTFEKLKRIFRTTKKTLWNILSVGCSKGEEVYTTAIVAKESGVNYKITGLDINFQRIIQAKKGCYRFWSVRFLKEGEIEKYFNIVNGEYCIKDEYKEHTRFLVGNILDEKLDCFEEKERFDIIFVRRVLFYLEPSKGIVEKLSQMLKDDGYLIVGMGEYHPEILERFTPSYPDTGAILRKIKPRESKELIEDYFEKKPHVKSEKKGSTVISKDPMKDKSSMLKEFKESQLNLPLDKGQIVRTIKADIESISYEERIRTIEELISKKRYKEAYELVTKMCSENITDYIVWKYRTLIELELSLTDSVKSSLQNALFLNNSDDEIWQLKHMIDLKLNKKK